jgi:hypothetical protein
MPPGHNSPKSYHQCKFSDGNSNAAMTSDKKPLFFVCFLFFQKKKNQAKNNSFQIYHNIV